MKNKKGNVVVIAIIIVIVAITAAVITWLVATRTQAPEQTAVVTQPAVTKNQPVAQPAPVDEIANWQTYSNMQYGFEFKYPQPYIATDLGKAVINGQADVPNIWVYNPTEKNTFKSSGVLINPGYYPFSIFVIQKPGVLDTYDERKNDKSYSKVTIAGHRALKSSSEYGNVYSLEDNGFMRYIIQIDKNDIGEKILSTFKFTDQQSSQIPADWKTYSNAKYAFEIKYPQSYTIQNVKDGFIVIKSPTNKLPYDIEILINPYSSLNNLDLDASIQSMLKDNQIMQQQKTTFAGQVAYEAVDTGLVSSYAILTKNGNNLYEILLNTGNKNSFAENKAALDANQKLMLATFKFTK